MSEPRRVLWVMKGLGLGGAERLLASSAPLVDTDRYALEVAYMLPWKDALVPELRDGGLPVHCVGEGTTGRLRWAGRLATLIRRERYDIVHTHAPVPATAARLVPGIRVYLHTEHNTWDRYRRVTRIANTATVGRNRHVIAVSSGVAESMVRPRWLPQGTMPPVEVLHHGVDMKAVRAGPEARATARRLLGLSADQPVVGTVGNMTPKKDQASMLRAFKAVVAARPDAVLVLIGTGPLDSELKYIASRELPKGAVLFTGIRTDVQDLLPGFDVFTLSSTFEGLSIALLEAMAAGVPCVGTRVGGIPEALRDGVEGLLVPARDPRALGRALNDLLDDTELRTQMGARGRTTSASFSIAAAVDRTQEIYDEVLAGL